jgi:hypothetical protein
LSTLGFLSVVTALSTVGTVGFGMRLVTWKTRALEREAQLIHMRLGKFRMRRKLRARILNVVS